MFKKTIYIYIFLLGFHVKYAYSVEIFHIYYTNIMYIHEEYNSVIYYRYQVLLYGKTYRFDSFKREGKTKRNKNISATTDAEKYCVYIFQYK